MANSGYLTSQDPVRMYSRAGEEQGPLREKSWRPCRHMSDMSQSSSERKGLVLLDSESQHLCPPPSPWDVVRCPAWCPLRGAKDTMGCRLIPLSLPPSLPHDSFDVPITVAAARSRDCPQVRFLASFTGTSPLKNNALQGPGQENEGRIKLT